MSERKTVYTRLSHDFDANLDPTLKDLLEDIQQLIARFGDTAYVSFDSGDVEIRIPREETDTEMNARILIEQQVKDHQRRKDLEQYEALKKKLGFD